MMQMARIEKNLCIIIHLKRPLVDWIVYRTFIGPRKKNHKILMRIHIPCISSEPSLNWSLVLDKWHWKFTENTQIGSFSTLLTRLVELGCEAESA